MKVLILTTSALKENSAGRATLRKVIRHFGAFKAPKGTEIKELILRDGDMSSDIPLIEESDLIIVTASPFHFGIQAQAKEKFFKLNETGCFAGKRVTFFISSGGGGDQILERELELLFASFGATVIPGYSCIDYAIFENHGVASLKTERSGNNIDDMAIWFNSLFVDKKDITSVVKVLIVRATNDGEYFNKCKEVIRANYPNVELIDVASLNLNKCIGCKLCYTVKKQCIFNDRYLEIAERLSVYKRIFFVSDFVGETLSPIMDNLVQRNVSDGLYPSKPEPQHNVYFFKTNGASPVAVDTVRFHFKALNSMEMNFYTIYFDDQFEEMFIDNEPREVYEEVVEDIEEPVHIIDESSIGVDANGNEVSTTIIKRVTTKKKRIIESEQESMTRFEFDMARTDFQMYKNTFPNVTGWTRMFVRHFARLINMIQNLLPVEYKFYKNHPMARFVEADQNIRPILSKESLKTSAKFKIEEIEKFDTSNYKLNSKRSFLSYLFSKR